MLSVRQMVVSDPAFSVTKSTTRTWTVSVLTQPFSSKLTWYLVVDLGKTRGVAMFALSILKTGDHVNVPLPDAFNSNVSMLHINVSLNASVICGLSSTATSVVIVSTHPF